MSGRRRALAALALVAGLATAGLAAVDVRYEDRTCGSALIASDPTKLIIETGDRVADDFEAERLSVSCHRRILRQRFAAAATLAVSLWAGTVASRPDQSGIFGI